MARKSRAAPPTIAQMMKLEAVYKAKQDAYYKASDAYYKASDQRSKYKERMKELGTGYTEVINGITYVLAIVPDRFGGTEMTLVECKK